jgi:hypothetical protein
MPGFLVAPVRTQTSSRPVSQPRALQAQPTPQWPDLTSSGVTGFEPAISSSRSHVTRAATGPNTLVRYDFDVRTRPAACRACTPRSSSSWSSSMARIPAGRLCQDRPSAPGWTRLGGAANRARTRKLKPRCIVCLWECGSHSWAGGARSSGSLGVNCAKSARPKAVA